MHFHRFPHTPHLAWLAAGQPRDDKLLAAGEAEEFLDADLVIEEKIDGANLGLSVDEEGVLRAQSRGKYLILGECGVQFKPLKDWLRAHESQLLEALYPHLMLFGEWCYAVHSVRYDLLPDWFLAFDVFDSQTGVFWSSPRRDELVSSLGIATVPRLAAGRFDLAGLRSLLGSSRVGRAQAEGLYLRKEDPGRLLARAKLVRPEFVQSIGEHWSKRRLEANALASSAHASDQRVLSPTTRNKP